MWHDGSEVHASMARRSRVGPVPWMQGMREHAYPVLEHQEGVFEEWLGVEVGLLMVWEGVFDECLGSIR